MESLPEPFSFWRQIAEQSWDIIVIVRADEDIAYISPSFQARTGRTPTLLSEWFDEVHSEFRVDVRNSWDRVRAEGRTISREFRMPDDRQGEPVWMESTWMPLNDAAAPMPVYAVLARDISARKKEEDELIRLAYHDPLTGLANRRFFADHLLRTLAYAKRNGLRSAIMCLDIDNFKKINDTMGHDVGDVFLQNFAARTGRILRETDLLARMGGDEFMVLLTDVDSEQGVTTVLSRLFASLRQEWEVGSHRFRATVSVGIAMYPDGGDDYTSLLKSVDIALYQVKHSGGDGFAFYHAGMSMNDAMQRRLYP